MEISAKKTLDGNRDYLRVARTLRDKLDGLITSGATDLGTQRKILLDVSQELDLVLANKANPRYDELFTCTHSCREHEQVMDPALWSTLPMELLQRVFANLPFPNICRLKLLSKEWKLSLQSSSSEFTLALKESSPGILARVNWGNEFAFWLDVLDGRNNRWHELHVNTARGVCLPANCRETVSVDWWVHMDGAADAGLMCYFGWDSLLLSNCIYVINPMTGVVNRLPYLKMLTYAKPTMMRIVVDRNTHHYKVIVVKHAPPVEAQVYDSEVQQWTKPKPSLGRIFGTAHRYFWDGFWTAHKLGPCAYDCRDGKYYDFIQDQEKWLGKEVMSYTLMKDRLFVLYWKTEEFSDFISEYRVPENATSWVKEKTHSCFSHSFWQPDVPGRILACSGFLFVFALVGKIGDPFNPPKKHEAGLVCDLATCEWRQIPPVPWGSTVQAQPYFTNVMCELHWNILP